MQPRRGRGLALTTLLALLLALASAAFAVRALQSSAWGGSPPRVLQGVFSPEEAPAARALVERLTRGLLRLQAADGGFDLTSTEQYDYLIERVSASAFATAALARVRTLAPDLRVEGLDAALGRGLDFVKQQQGTTGAVGIEEPKDRWSQVDATSAAVLAFALTGRPEDEAALVGAGQALRRFARAGLRNGWTRALGLMTVAKVEDLDRSDVFDGDPRSLADVRQLKSARAGPPRTTDWNVAEAISRVVLGLRKGVDPFPGRLVQAVLDDPPEWGGQSADCQAFWMQAWLVARSGAETSPAWFADLVQAIRKEGVEADDTIHGGWYAKGVGQTAGAILSLIEGLSSQVVVVKGVGATPENPPKTRRR